VKTVHAGDVDALNVVIEKTVEHRPVEQIAIGLDHELGRFWVAIKEAAKGMEQQVGPDEDFPAGQNDPIYGDLGGVGQVMDASRDLIEGQAGGIWLGIVVAVGTPLIAITTDNPINRFQDRTLAMTYE